MPSHERVIYLPAGAPSTFCVAHVPDADLTEVGVLLCSPFGWEDMASYRSRRFWAVQLAAAGHAVLRFDPPGAGDSAGSPADPARLDEWCAAITHGEAWLRAAGCGRVAVIGFGIGGLIALRALGLGASFEDLVTWGTPADGRTAVRELRAFSRLQQDKPTGGGPNLPEGWLEVGGYVLPAATSTGLLALDPTALSAPSLRRVLVLEREDAPGDGRLAESLSGLEAAVARAPGPGYATFVSHPQTSQDPAGVLSTVSGWLAAPGVSRQRGRRSDAQLASAHELHLGDDEIREVPVTIPHDPEAMQGILASPTGMSCDDLGAVFLNAGALRRTGPNRLWVETARSWAAAGTPVLRLDLAGIGDSGRRQGPLPTPCLYVPELLDQAHAAVEWLLRASQVTRVVVVGLCSGGHLAFDVASRERRVCAVVLINPTALVWDRNAEQPRYPPGPRLLLSRDHLLRRGRAARSLPGDLARWAASALRRELTFQITRRSIERRLDTLRASDTHVVLALSEREPEQLRLTVHRNRVRLRRWSNVVHVALPGTDHTLRPIAAQRRIRQILEETRSREIARAHRAADPLPAPRARAREM